jgi:hypothetical protein
MYGDYMQAALLGRRYVLIMGCIDVIPSHHFRQLMQRAPKLGDGVIAYKPHIVTVGKKAGGVVRIAGREKYLEIADIVNDLIEVVDIRPCSLVFGIEYASVNKNLWLHSSMY